MNLCGETARLEEGQEAHAALRGIVARAGRKVAV